MQKTNIRPVRFQVLILPDPVEEKTKGGIILPESSKDEKQYAQQRGTVIAASKRAFSDYEGDGAPKAGDRVYFRKYAGDKIKDGDTEYVLCGDEDVCAVIETPQAVAEAA